MDQLKGVSQCMVGQTHTRTHTHTTYPLSPPPLLFPFICSVQQLELEAGHTQTQTLTHTPTHSHHPEQSRDSHGALLAVEMSQTSPDLHVAVKPSSYDFLCPPVRPTGPACLVYIPVCCLSD